MKKVDVIQGSEAWLQSRLGIPTASNFKKILTATGKLSTSATEYMCELVAESIIGQPCDNSQSSFMERGTELEADAVDLYAYQNDVNVERVGFCLRDDGLVGCSPDGLVGENGGLEIKCPSAKMHVLYLDDEATFVKKYKLQVQGSLYVTGRKWWDMMSYSPTIHSNMPSVIVRCERDEKFIALLDEAMGDFVTRLERVKKKIKAMKVVEVPLENFPF